MYFGQQNETLVSATEEVRYVLVYTETNVFCMLHLVKDIVCEHWRESVHIRTYILYIFRSILISWFSCFVYLDRSKLKSDSHSVYIQYMTRKTELFIPWLFRAERRGFSARVPRNFRAGAAELPRGWARIFRASGRRSSSVWIRFENGGNQKANFVRNNAKRSRNTPQGSFEISL